MHELYKSDKLVVTEKFDKVKLLSDLQDMYTEGYHSHIEKKTADFNKMTDMLTETINTEKLFLVGIIWLNLDKSVVIRKRRVNF